MATVTITAGDIDNIQIDGNSAGDIFTAAANHPEALADIKAAVSSLIAQGNAAAMDNNNLREQMASYLTATDGGKAAFAWLQDHLKSAKIAALQAELSALSAEQSGGS